MKMSTSFFKFCCFFFMGFFLAYFPREHFISTLVLIVRYVLRPLGRHGGSCLGNINRGRINTEMGREEK
jgi:hypothetical protein